MKDPALTELRKQLRESMPIPAVPAPPAPRTAQPAEAHVDDATLFARATQGAQRLQSTVSPPASHPAPQRQKPDANTFRRRAAAVEEEAASGPISDTAALMYATAPEEILSYARNGVQVRAVQRLRQGQTPWQAAVDLHGCTVDQARDAVLKLVMNGHREGFTVVKIVHGKGLQQSQPLLKTCVNGWLRQIPEVLAFVSALPRDGGAGAVYVLLKKRRVEADQALSP